MVPWLTKINPRVFRNVRPLTTVAAEATVEYPPILDNSYKSKINRKTLEWRKKIEKISTIEEKLIELNIPRYYGYKVCMLGELIN